MTVGDRFGDDNAALTGSADRLSAMLAERAVLLAEFNDLVVTIKAAQTTGDPANAPLSRLQAIDRELKQLDADAAELMAKCIPLLAGGGDA